MSTVPIIESEGDKHLARLLLCVANYGYALENSLINPDFLNRTDKDRFTTASSELDEATAAANRHLYRQL